MERFVPRVFISYSWDGTEHQCWVKDLAARLRSNGVDVTLDQWEVKPATRLPHFMENAVRENDFVLIVCTEAYRKKADNRMGGVGYEDTIIAGEILERGNLEKFIPLLRSGAWLDSRPSWLAGATYLDFRGSPYQEAAYLRLLDTIFGVLPQAPPLGSRVPGWGLDLQYRNDEFGVLLRICNCLKARATYSITLQGMDKGRGNPSHLEKGAFPPVPLAIREPVGPSNCAPWMPWIFTTKADFSELKIESKDPLVPSVFVRERGIWRVRIVVVSEAAGSDVFSVWLSWMPGRSPEACDDPKTLGFTKCGTS